jgi:N-acetylmuramoyl-L-alanine amidase
MKIYVNPGHTLSGPGSGSIGIKNESVENRKVTKEVIRLLKEQGYEVIDATVDKATLLVECCFIDNENDMKVYSLEGMLKAIVEGIGKDRKEVG